MPEPCVQAPTIDRIDRKLDNLTEAISQLAAQRTEIGHLAQGHKDNRNWLKGHEERIQACEKAPGVRATRAWLVIYTGGVGAIFGVLVLIARGTL